MRSRLCLSRFVRSRHTEESSIFYFCRCRSIFTADFIAAVVPTPPIIPRTRRGFESVCFALL
ncbi:predicted protein [Arabidopsis lyrata subsp. lyrata]|uniref:Predicted protein n=1 Tax=Arabidopsis lyrata subsp. lyrata TaxID=81972 RepID=D7L5C5_ARALL|nr:predicted protein [Arabidopsis lyrata subsp. lyrata]